MNFISQEINEYLNSHTSSEPEILKELNRETHLKVLSPRMLSGHYQGRLLAFISSIMRPKRILEIGTYTGYSALCLAEGLVEGGELITIDQNRETLIMARSYIEKSGQSDMITIMEGTAGAIIPGLNGEFDLVFIDADKQNYRAYYEAVLPKLRKGGVIIADNVLWSGKVTDKSISDENTREIRNFNDAVQNDDRVENIILPVRDGLLLAIKK